MALIEFGIGLVELCKNRHKTSNTSYTSQTVKYNSTISNTEYMSRVNIFCVAVLDGGLFQFQPS